jgi:acyl-CoA dehydrogenase
MGKTPRRPTRRQQSMILVPRDTPGLTIVRHLPIFGYQDQHGHSELVFRQRARARRQPAGRPWGMAS